MYMIQGSQCQYRLSGTRSWEVGLLQELISRELIVITIVIGILRDSNKSKGISIQWSLVRIKTNPITPIRIIVKVSISNKAPKPKPDQNNLTNLLLHL